MAGSTWLKTTERQPPRQRSEDLALIDRPYRLWGMGKALTPHGTVRRGLIEDEEQVRTISDEAFTVFGEYGSWLPGYLGHPGVWTYVYEEAGVVAAFAMLGILEPEEQGGGRLGDLLAIAVQRGYQDRGVGTLLLERVLSKAGALHRLIELNEIRLTVADTNARAQHLFGRFGFTVMVGEHGFYEKGQKALRLQLRL